MRTYQDMQRKNITIQVNMAVFKMVTQKFMFPFWGTFSKCCNLRHQFGVQPCCAFEA